MKPVLFPSTCSGLFESVLYRDSLYLDFAQRAGCHASAADLSARLAIVPMCQEARGLDAGPRLVEKLVGLGDNRTAAIVRRIAEEERAHVAVGVVWFKRVCCCCSHALHLHVFAI